MGSYNYITKNVDEIKEIKEKRTLTAKFFQKDDYKIQGIFHCKPIHYLDDKQELRTIDLTLIDDGSNYLMEKNKFSIGFRKDGSLTKYVGLRKGYDNQFEMSLSKLIVNGKELAISEFSKIEKINDYELKHIINENIFIHNRLHECYLKEAVVINTKAIPIFDLEVWYEVNLKGFTTDGITEKVITVKDKLQQDKQLTVTDTIKYKLDTDNKFWLPTPIAWVENNESIKCELLHRIEVKDGKTYYVKSLSDISKKWIAEQEGKVIYFDATTYYSTTADGYVSNRTEGGWSTVRGATSGYYVNSSDSYDSGAIGAFYSDCYNLSRAFFYFDTSGISDDATVTDASLSLYRYSTGTSVICAQKGTQGTSLGTADFDSFSGNSYGTVTPSAGYFTITFDSTGISDISLTSTTKICVREYTHDYQNSDPGTTAYQVGCYFANNTGTDKDPYLSITFITTNIITSSNTIGLSTAGSFNNIYTIKGITKLGINNYTKIGKDEYTPINWELIINNNGIEYNIGELNILEELDCSMVYDKKSNIINLTLLNDGNYWNKFEKGGTVSFYLINTDEDNYYKKKIFEGVINYVKQTLNNYDYSTIQIRAENYGLFRLKQTLITGMKEYINLTPTKIIANLIETYAPDILLDKLDDIDINIPYKIFNWVYLNEAIEEIVKLIEGYFYIDVNNYLIIKLFSDQAVVTNLTIDKIKNIDIEDNTEDVFDRIFILGGKENLLENDFNDEDIVLGINTTDYYYGFKITTDKTNLLSIKMALSKVGIPRFPLTFDIVADNEGIPSNMVLASGSFYEWDIQETASWVKSSPLSVNFTQPTTFWILINQTIDFNNYYVIYHDNTTANGYSRHSGDNNWSSQTGAIAVKTYYGYQIVTIKKGTKQLNEYYSDLIIIDENIQTDEMGSQIANKMLLEKQYKKSSYYTLYPTMKLLIPPCIVNTNIEGIINENQIITEINYHINQNKVLDLNVYCLKTLDFYNMFSNLFKDLRQLNVNKIRENISRGIEYLNPTSDIELNENISSIEADNAITYYLGDPQWIFGVFKWD